MSASIGSASHRELAAGQPHLAEEFVATRLVTAALCKPLAPEDMVVQSMPDCSPAKWHLAHTTWFFEHMVLATAADHRPYHPEFARLFNSYYQLDPPAHPRPERGLLSRPTTPEVLDYRSQIDAAVLALLEAAPGQTVRDRVMVGLHHERQHQELLLTDVLHLFSRNPLRPCYRPPRRRLRRTAPPMRFLGAAGGTVTVGAQVGQFSFDNERPRHQRLIPPFRLASRLTTNGEFAGFIRDGGYRRRELWLSAGWDEILRTGLSRPLYWNEGLDGQFTLEGPVELDAGAPVCHVSYFEADAFARWSDARLPREEEWEFSAQDCAVAGNLLDEDVLTPLPARSGAPGFQQLFGDAWEWTQSAYSPYAGFRADPAPLDQYNGPFMVGQMVLRGGSCLSPAGHIRATYRNYLPPSARWQVSGIRLARDA